MQCCPVVSYSPHDLCIAKLDVRGPRLWSQQLHRVIIAHCHQHTLADFTAYINSGIASCLWLIGAAHQESHFLAVDYHIGHHPNFKGCILHSNHPPQLAISSVYRNTITTEPVNTAPIAAKMCNIISSSLGWCCSVRCGAAAGCNTCSSHI